MSGGRRIGRPSKVDRPETVTVENLNQPSQAALDAAIDILLDLNGEIDYELEE